MDFARYVFSLLGSFATGALMTGLLVGIGFYLSLGTGFLQVRKFGRMISETAATIFRRRGKAKEGAISPFAALSTALAGTLGTGNIAGVATALVAGGPGAIFWMWVSGFFGMMTKYAEALLAVKYREKNKNGEWAGGPMYYIKNGLKKEWSALAPIFAFFGVLASFGIGNITQVNSISGSVRSTFGADARVTGVILMAVCGVIIIGGIKRISKVAEKLVPFISILYFIAAAVVIIAHFGQLGSVFALIFRCAFSARSAVGGIAGYTVYGAMRIGIGRGVFTNEAGLGSASIAHAASDTDSPVRQGMWGALEVFVDTIVICTLTALVILCSGVIYSATSSDGRGAVTLLDGAPLTASSFATVIGSAGHYLITFSIILFAFASVMTWSYYGEKCVEFLFKKRTDLFKSVYRAIFILAIFAGCVINIDIAWAIADILNAFMAMPNMLALLLLSPVVFRETKAYFSR